MPDLNALIGKLRSGSNRPLMQWLHLHKDKLWWMHSLYALVLGIGIMWLGKRNFAFLRVAVFHIGFIWLSSLFLPKLLQHPRLPARWAPRVRLLVNFFNKNFYQQVLFFVLPIYYASSTLSSLNIVFVLLVALSATLSTLDIVYDRYVSVKRGLTAVFFAFNLFALINVMLPVLWSVSNTWTTRISAVLAFIGLVTLGYRSSPSKIRGRVVVALIGFFLLALVELGRPFIPPAPLRLVSVEFGTDFNKESFGIESPLTKLSSAQSLRLYGLTAIKAPLGLREKVQHRWYMNGKLIFASPFYSMTGGREEGFRHWTSYTFENIPARTELRLDLMTEGGQLIGRARLL
jgi:hypothetical protein